jgi:hypothetical protein
MLKLYRKSGLILTALAGAAGATNADARSVGLIEPPTRDATQLLLESRVEHAREIMIEALGRMLEDGHASKNQIAQWYNWPNWNNWGNFWRNW